MHRKVAAKLVVVVVGVAVVGCSGSGKPAVTKSAFVRQTEAVCTRLNKENLRAYNAVLARMKSDNLTEADVRAQVFAKATANRRLALADFRAIHPPADLQATFTKWQGALRASFAMGLGAFHQSGAEHARRNAMAHKLLQLESSLGLRACR